MIKSMWKRFLELDFLVKLIFIFCLYGWLINTIFLCRDIRQDGLLFRLHLGFWVLYSGQIVFILLKERMVFVLSFLQAILAFLTNADFTFVPVLRAAGFLAYSLKGGFTVEEMDVYKYIFMSGCLTLEMLKTYWLFALLPAPKKKRPQGAAAAADGAL